MDCDLDAKRRYLLSLAVQVDKRLIDDPNEWRPYEVSDPCDCRQTFTHEMAWELIVKLLEEGHPMRPVLQRSPQGAIAYEMVFCLEDSWNVYIKIRPGKRGHIFGRSFHYAERF
jgi:hypothetical protein